MKYNLKILEQILAIDINSETSITKNTLESKIFIDKGNENS